MAFGAVDPLSEFIIQMGAAGLLLIWFLRSVRRKHMYIFSNWLYLPFFGLCSVAFVQYIFGLSAYPYATKIELLKLGAYLALSFLLAQSIRTEKERERCAWFLTVLVFIVSLFGILQFFTWNGKLYWVRLVANAGTSFGPYVNRDHFAGFVELTVPFAFALPLSGTVALDKLALVSLCGVLPIGAVVLSGSRGGILSVFCEIVILGLLLRKRVRVRRELVTAVLLIALCGGMIAWLGTEKVALRFKALTSSELSRDRRISMYRDTFRIFLDHPWMGTGLGTLQFVYPRYESFYDGSIVDHAHNDYLELLADTGIAGGFCSLVFILILFRQGLINVRHAASPAGNAFYCGALAACAGVLLHSVVDFNLHIPSNALLFFLIAFVATSSISIDGSEKQVLAPAPIAEVCSGHSI